MAALGVDHVGSVLVSEKSWRSETLKSTVEQVRSSGKKSSLIPLFGSVDTIARAIDYYRPDIIHFCETMPACTDDRSTLDPLLNRQRFIRERFTEIELMRSVPIGVFGQADLFPSLDLASEFEPLSDWFLTDTLLGTESSNTDDQQPVDGFVGITGKTCDWRIAGQLVKKCGIPVILAGGIGPQNVVSAISQVQPAGVDSCTLTNAVDPSGNPIRFRKDPDKVHAMITGARQAGTKNIIQ